LVLIMVKSLHTEAAARTSLPFLGPKTSVLTLQNGWGNVPKLQAILGSQRVLAGITVHSGTLVGPGHVRHAGIGPATIGELDGQISNRVRSIAGILAATGEVHVSPEIVKVIWSKLCLNVCALPACALLRFYSGELLKHESLLELMRALLRETVAVATAQGTPLDFDERWAAITAQLARAGTVRASMLQDVEARRCTEIDAINGAVVEVAHRLGIPIPHNETLVWLIRALDASLAPDYKPTALPSLPATVTP
ncbi:MAG: ketopantoate reductase family protein, partial [Opitutaceae bacterium]